MKHLQFDGKYTELLKTGKKRLTIRIEKPNLRKGDIVIVHAGGKVIGKFKILDIYTKKLHQITDEEAQLDGFNNKEELFRALKEHYPWIKENREIVIIRFEPVEIFRDDINSEDFAWKGLKIDLMELARLALKYDNKLTEKQKQYLKILIDEGSLRKAAMKLGGLQKRAIFRKILRRSMDRLIEKG
ncbi:MAG TPA: ASCH domain-containing protein, partial [Candidatus Nanopusillus sp.]|nr:ASCH domain-containing protein [Candidatus Nanopusillus sp.]